MQPAHQPDVLRATPLPELRRFRQVLADANYTPAGHTEVLSPLQLAEPRNLPHLLRITSEHTQLETLVLMFLYGYPTEAHVARRALEPLSLEALQEMGLLRVQGNVVQAQVSLVPFADLILAVDLEETIHRGAPSDVVMGITKSTAELVNITVRRKIRRALDFGTGCGIQAFQAAKHSDRVYGIECAHRAVNFACFNAALNEIPNVEIVEGNCLDAVASHRFDLIVANPPFAVTPERRYVYRDSGMHLDAFAKSLVQRAPVFLEEGGFFQCQCDWVHIAGEDWRERLSKWVEGSGCNAWIIRQQTLSPAIYAEAWIRSTEQESRENVLRLCEQWTEFYRKEQVEAISTGFICLQRASSGANWLRIDDAPGEISEGTGDSILLGFALRDFLEANRDDAKLLATRLHTSPNAHLARELEWSKEGWRAVGSRIRMVDGFSYTAGIDSNMAALMAHCDGRHTLFELFSQMAAGIGISIERVIPAALPLMRRLIESGFLLPIELFQTMQATRTAAPPSDS